MGADTRVKNEGGQIPAPERFEAFYEREYPRMVTLAFALTGDRLAAEDLAQDVFIDAHRRWSEIGSYEKPGAWLRRAVINRSRSVVRRARIEFRALRRIGRGDEVASDMPEDARQFWTTVRSLSARQAQCVVLHYLEDLPVAEIAGLVGCTEATVRVHLHRGRAALAQRLQLDQEET
jgi:RNA polymerase sigma-70 factor (ECF subfamily)